jgi:hypothetical protein
MQVYGLDSIRSELESDGYFFKLLANERAALFFPRSIEHRDAKAHGLDYEDDLRGNALAATVVPGRVDFRRHRAFSDERVKSIALAILGHPDTQFACGFQVTYQGRLLIAGKA